ncbi:NUDIX domain-containing protein [Streptomyces sp. NPDC088707]|uniref:NUDIX domain-containing protein n=1 Tax=Streptomyces sp. NPDC088707 TaxID=3365871 RepID=UPI00380D5CA8
MPPSLSHVRDLVTAYLAEHPDEHPDLSGLLHSLDADGDPTHRSTLPGHITCSAVVIDRARRVLHVRHNASGLLLPPGGHVETSDASLLAAALRELEEETGLPASALVLTSRFGDRPIDIGVHDIDARPSKAEPAHQHYDVCFVFRLTDDASSPALAPQTEEVSEAVWLSSGEVHSPALRAKLARSGRDGTIVPVNAGAVAGRRPFLPMEASARDLLAQHAAEHAVPAADLTAGSETGAHAAAPPGTVPHIVGVHLYLEHDGRILLGRRHPDSAYAGGSWHALAGHCERESATACLVREAYEEAGLVIDREDLELVHTVHLVDRPGEGGRERPGAWPRERPEDRPPRIQLFFRAGRWEGTPELREPDKCCAWQWWSPGDLPEAIVPYTRAAIEGVQAGRPYTEWGWAR